MFTKLGQLGLESIAKIFLNIVSFNRTDRPYTRSPE